MYGDRFWPDQRGADDRETAVGSHGNAPHDGHVLFNRLIEDHANELRLNLDGNHVEPRGGDEIGYGQI